ncbi:5'-methylthioadenosine/S-adenosylhomocysteine nucleosidase [Candidatus Erwinia haradaeae]|uniref:adenosylhomocysteine nucleosidase n=1 Tax=Candidatus Erwinia haradaeae TaxID=1922217 RepID=A0A451D2B8_9GAMM|nr:5'-methylthioadenosine/S-adenosylhomocysteine nucleosidase [Candidatus Erwinia haradaeae]VFP79786.1 5'-methylthioadenosine/S-adenosylhomocysteine nucleosidase [Candidatus Erwinia haradaeae]
MKVGIIGAIEEEIEIIRDKIFKKNRTRIAKYNIDIGMFNGVEIFLLKSGVGKVSAALSSALLLHLYKPNIVINIGSAGGLISTLKIGDIVISSEVSYHDVDVTEYNYQLGQIPGYAVNFQANYFLIKLAELCIQKLNFFSVRGLMVSGDIFIHNQNQIENILNSFTKAIAVDMESAAIGHVCCKFSTPFVSVRTISDHANFYASINFNNYITIAAQKSFLVIEKMITYLSNLDISKLNLLYER